MIVDSHSGVPSQMTYTLSNRGSADQIRLRGILPTTYMPFQPTNRDGVYILYIQTWNTIYSYFIRVHRYPEVSPNRYRMQEEIAARPEKTITAPTSRAMRNGISCNTCAIINILGDSEVWSLLGMGWNWKDKRDIKTSSSVTEANRIRFTPGIKRSTSPSIGTDLLESSWKELDARSLWEEKAFPSWLWGLSAADAPQPSSL